MKSIGLLSSTFLFALGRLAVASPHESDSTRTLHRFFDAEWDYTMEQQPLWASSLGDRR